MHLYNITQNLCTLDAVGYLKNSKIIVIVKRQKKILSVSNTVVKISVQTWYIVTA